MITILYGLQPTEIIETHYSDVDYLMRAAAEQRHRMRRRINKIKIDMADLKAARDLPERHRLTLELKYSAAALAAAWRIYRQLWRQALDAQIYMRKRIMAAA